MGVDQRCRRRTHIGRLVRRSAIRRPDRFCLRHTAHAASARASCFLDCSLAVYLRAVSAIALVIESRYSPGRKDSMMLRRFFECCSEKSSALAHRLLWAAPLLIGLVAGYKTADQAAVLRTMLVFGSAALVFGTLARYLASVSRVRVCGRAAACYAGGSVGTGCSLVPSLAGISSLLCFAPANRFDLRSLRKHRSAASAILLMVRCRASAELDEQTTHHRLVTRSE